MRKLNYSLKELVLADLYRYEGKTDTKSFLHAYATYEGFKFSVWLRMCSVARKKKLRNWPRITNFSYWWNSIQPRKVWKKHNAISEHNCWNDNSQWKKAVSSFTG